MKEYLKEFYAAENTEAQWRVCQRYVGAQWHLWRTGIGASCESDGRKFMVATLTYNDIGSCISVATRGIPHTKTWILVSPPRTLSDLEDCHCPLICYDE